MLAPFLQVGAIIGTGIAAVIVPNRQLRAYNNALESANRMSLPQLDQSYGEDWRQQVELCDFKFSPQEARPGL